MLFFLTLLGKSLDEHQDDTWCACAVYVVMVECIPRCDQNFTGCGDVLYDALRTTLNPYVNVHGSDVPYICYM